MTEPERFAEAGEIVTCENGHEICTVLADLHRGQKVQAEMFGDWQEGQIKGEAGNAIATCHCGALFVKQQGTGFALHFPDGWRPKRNFQ